MVKARKYVVKTTFVGIPKKEDFEIVEHELPPIKNGEVLVKTEWISVDPYMRAYNARYPTPYDQFGYQVGLVQESKDPRYPVGSRIVSHKGWCDYAIVNNSATSMKPYKLPDLKELPISLGVGAVGMPGATAYFGFLELCQPKSGETVVVTGAAGAVGSIVGQIAKIKGCRVIGFAGDDSKCSWLESIGFDKAYNYKTADISSALNEAAPEGVDCYFDNVGGEISSIVLSKMNLYGRIAVCGSISSYNEVDTPKASILQMHLVSKQLKMEGFLVSRWEGKWGTAFADIIHWIRSGKMKTEEHITEGFDNLYEAFVGMLAGENVGKAVVKV
jgi:prostaglandin reductase 1